MQLDTTTGLTRGGRYINSAEKFFAEFGGAWSAVKHQILKLETRQIYMQPESKSLAAFERGETQLSEQLLQEDLSADFELYKSLKEKGAEFYRCRPVLFPVSDYLAWELMSYKLSAQHGEKIFCCDPDVCDGIFQKHALHDFMVFDTDIAFIHDYDDRGSIEGGWVIRNPSSIANLIALYGLIKANSTDFLSYLKAKGHAG